MAGTVFRGIIFFFRNGRRCLHSLSVLPSVWFLYSNIKKLYGFFSGFKQLKPFQLYCLFHPSHSWEHSGQFSRLDIGQTKLFTFIAFSQLIEKCHVKGRYKQNTHVHLYTCDLTQVIIKLVISFCDLNDKQSTSIACQTSLYNVESVGLELGLDWGANLITEDVVFDLLTSPPPLLRAHEHSDLSSIQQKYLQFLLLM